MPAIRQPLAPRQHDDMESLQIGSQQAETIVPQEMLGAGYAPTCHMRLDRCADALRDIMQQWWAGGADTPEDSPTGLPGKWAYIPLVGKRQEPRRRQDWWSFW